MKSQPARLRPQVAARRGRGDRGVALIIVLFLAAILTLFMYSFLREMQVEASLASSYGKEKQAEQLAWSAIDKGTAIIEADTQAYATPASAWRDSATEFYEIALGDGVFALYGAPDAVDARPRWGATDEGAKVNLNVAPRDVLMKLPRMTDEIADSILDWRDADENVTGQGGENAYYQSLQPGYACKNAPFDTVEELLLVKGVTPEILYGEDTNLNGRLDPSENDGETTPPNDNSDGVLDVGLASLLTVWSYDRNRRDDGTARVNLNTATPQALRDALGDVLNQQELNNLQLRKLQFTPPGAYPSVAHLLNVQGVQPAGISKEKFKRIVDRVTVVEGETIPGLVNVNTAPPEVLELLPGLAAEDVLKMLEYRTQVGADLSNIGWLTDALTNDKLQRIANFVTVRSWQFRFDAVGRVGPKSELAEDVTPTVTPSATDRVPPPRVMKRYLAVWDRGGEKPRLLWWKDATRLGAPYSVQEATSP